MVRVADCVPVLLADPEAGVVGAAHAGGAGMALGVVPAAVGRMRDLGAGRGLRAWLGPAGVRRAATRCRRRCAPRSPRAVPAAWSTTSWGTPALDLAAGCRPSSRLACRCDVADVVGAGAVHRRVRRPVLLPARRASGRAGWPGSCTGPDAAVTRRDRRDEVAAGLGRPYATGSPPRARGAGRDPGRVTLVVVTKTFPASDVRLLAELGVRDVGREPPPGGGPRKARRLRRPGEPDLRWHFVGGLQTQQGRGGGRLRRVVHSVDRARLVGGLDAGRAERGRPDRLPGPGQPRPARAGAAGRARSRTRSSWSRDAVAAAEALRLRGVMAVAPLGADPARRSPGWRRSRPILRRATPPPTWSSAGHERRPRAGGRRRRDTPACRARDPR